MWDHEAYARNLFMCLVELGTCRHALSLPSLCTLVSSGEHGLGSVAGVHHSTDQEVDSPYTASRHRRRHEMTGGRDRQRRQQQPGPEQDGGIEGLQEVAADDDAAVPLSDDAAAADSSPPRRMRLRSAR